jgi:HtrA serine peptidase 2
VIFDDRLRCENDSTLLLREKMLQVSRRLVRGTLHPCLRTTIRSEFYLRSTSSSRVFYSHSVIRPKASPGSLVAAATAAVFSGFAAWSGRTDPPALEGAPPYLTANFIADAAAQASPALVNIQVGSAFAQSSGSGFIIDSCGIILTNTHVVSHARGVGGHVKVTLSDGVTELRGIVTHADTAADIAIVKVNPGRNLLPTAKLGTSADLRPGEFVVALGAPAGLSNSVSAGIVSAVHRTRSEIGMREFGRGASATRNTMVYIQTDAAINSGNSGGPLLNLRGEVIGVNTMKAMGMDGIAFALPIDDVKRVVHQLQRHGRVLRPYLGLKFIELDPGIAHELRQHAYRHHQNSSGPPSSGLYVMHVTPDSPAQRGGVRVGDTITGISGSPLRTTKELLDGLSDKVGQSVLLELQRDEQCVSATCEVESMQQ